MHGPVVQTGFNGNDHWRTNKTKGLANYRTRSGSIAGSAIIGTERRPKSGSAHPQRTFSSFCYCRKGDCEPCAVMLIRRHLLPRR
jgi:hypothetical protein